MSRPVLALLSALIALAPASALAAGAGDCPDGWFCDEGGASPGAPPSAAPSGARPPESPSPSARPSGSPAYTPPSYPPPGYAGPGEDHEAIELEAQEPPAPRRHRRRDKHEWGFNLHLEDALLGNKRERASNAEMAGLGVGLRYRPLPPLAFEAGLDLLTGTDFNGYDRTEVALLVNALVFFNPHDVVQVYVLGGLGLSGANVNIVPRSSEAFERHHEHYTYFGGQVGFGAEVRVSRRVGISGDIVGFIRGRTDDDADTNPEFTDPETNRATNTSGGGLLRLGATFYW